MLVDIEQLSIRTLWCATERGAWCFKLLDGSLSQGSGLRQLLDRPLTALSDDDLRALSDAVLRQPHMAEAPSAAEEVSNILTGDRRGFGFDVKVMPGPGEAIDLARSTRLPGKSFHEAYAEFVVPVVARDLHIDAQFRMAFELVRVLDEAIAMVCEATGRTHREVDEQLRERLQE